MQMNETISPQFFLKIWGLCLLTFYHAGSFLFFFLPGGSYSKVSHRAAHVISYLLSWRSDGSLGARESLWTEYTMLKTFYLMDLGEKSKVRQPVHHSPEHLGCLAVREVLALLEVPGKKRSHF